jgi:multiple sugar transport system substrate-binding protein
MDQAHDQSRAVSRRQVLRWGGTLAASAIGSLLLAACGGNPTATPATAATTSSSTTSKAATTSSAAAAQTSSATTSAAASSAATSSAATSSAATSAATSSTATSSPGGAATGSPAASASPSGGQQGAPSYIAHTDVAGEILFWHFWGSSIRRTAIRRVIAQFNQMYPKIKVNETFVPFSDIFTRALAAVAAGKGMPDVLVDDRTQLRTRAKNKIDNDLADLAKRDKVTGDSFWPFTWEESVSNGDPYGLPYETDIRVLYYNKAALKDAGLDPETPPKNWDDLATYADKLDQKDGNKLTRIGFYPLIGNIGLDSWAWCNGGEWQTKDFEPTMNDPKNVEALAWIKKWTDRYGKSNIDAFKGTFGQGNQDEFMSGKVAMKVDIQGYTSFLNFYNPSFKTKDGQDAGYGVADIPPAPGNKPASFSGGFAMVNPRGSQQTEAAWEFIKYMSFVGQASWARDTYAMPTVESVAKNDPVLNAQPNWPFFVKAMDYGRAGVYNPYYPTMMGDLLGPAVDDVLVRNKTPQEALDNAQQKAKQEVDKNKKG